MNKKKAMIITAIAVLLIGIFAVGYSWYSNNNKSEYEQKVEKIVAISEEDQQKYIDQIVEEGQINIQYSLGTTFNGKTSQGFNVKNIENNNGDIVFTIYDESGNEIYNSKPIQRGYECTEITLDKELPVGIHECRISIGYVDAGNVRSTFPITIEVK